MTEEQSQYIEEHFKQLYNMVADITDNVVERSKINNEILRKFDKTLKELESGIDNIKNDYSQLKKRIETVEEKIKSL